MANFSLRNIREGYAEVYLEGRLMGSVALLHLPSGVAWSAVLKGVGGIDGFPTRRDAIKWLTTRPGFHV